MSNNYIPREKRKTKIKYTSWECFSQTLNYYENKLRKKLNPRDLLRNAKQEFPGQVWKVSLENTTTRKINSLAFILNMCAPNKLAQITV